MPNLSAFYLPFLCALCGKNAFVFAFSATIPFATAATSQTDDAADIREPLAAIVPIRHQQPSFPRSISHLVAPRSPTPADHRRGNCAITRKIITTHIVHIP